MAIDRGLRGADVHAPARATARTREDARGHRGYSAARTARSPALRVSPRATYKLAHPESSASALGDNTDGGLPTIRSQHLARAWFSDWAMSRLQHDIRSRVDPSSAST